MHTTDRRSVNRLAPRLLTRISTLVFVSMFLPTLPAGSARGAPGTDNFEPNDNPAQAHAIENDTTVESWLSYFEDNDWFTFSTETTGTITVTLQSLPMDYDLELYWYNPDTGQLMYDTGWSSTNPDTENEAVSVEVGVTGDFYVRVYGFLGNYDAGDSYLLRAAFPSEEPPAPPVVTLLAPNGGETLIAGSQATISYTATDADTPGANLRITLEYSLNGGATWNPIASNQTNTGSYAWTVPNAPTSQGRVRVTATDGALQGADASGANFTIEAPPQGENTIVIGTATGASGVQATVDVGLENEDQVKGLQVDIAFDPAIVRYEEGEAAQRGSGFTYAASVVGGSKVRVVLYRTDAGSLAAGTGTVARLTFTLIGAGGTATGLDPSGAVLSDPQGRALRCDVEAGSISIVGAAPQPPVVTLVAPNGGETLTSGTQRVITYTATDPDTPAENLSIAIAYSTNSGASWTTIVDGVANNGSYSWSVPNVSTTRGRIRVTASDGALQGSDSSNADFTIAPPTQGDNTLAISSASGSSGARATISLTLTNEDVVKGLQVDIVFDPTVIRYEEGRSTGRGTGFTYAASMVGGDRLRVALYFADATDLPAGTGAIADLTFTLIGAPGSGTDLTLSDAVLSDAAGGTLPIQLQAGAIGIDPAGGDPPTLRLAILKNPGRVRTIQVLLTADRALDQLTVTAGATTIPMRMIDEARHVYAGTFHAANGAATVTISATGISTGRTGTAQAVVGF